MPVSVTLTMGWGAWPQRQGSLGLTSSSIRTLTALQEDPGSVPSTHMSAHNLSVTHSWGPDTHGKNANAHKI